MFIHPASAIVHHQVQEVISAARNNRPLVAHLAVPWLSKQSAELIFPIRHINVQPATGQFQVETGPILWPLKRSNKTQSEKKVIEALSRAYTIFNRFDEVKIAENIALEVLNYKHFGKCHIASGPSFSF